MDRIVSQRISDCGGAAVSVAVRPGVGACSVVCIKDASCHPSAGVLARTCHWPDCRKRVRDRSAGRKSYLRQSSVVDRLSVVSAAVARVVVLKIPCLTIGQNDTLYLRNVLGFSYYRVSAAGDIDRDGGIAEFVRRVSPRRTWRTPKRCRGNRKR